MQTIDRRVSGSILVSRDVNLQDIFQRSIPNGLGVLIDDPLSKEDAERLVVAIETLATRIEDISHFNFILLCKCSRHIAGIVLKALPPLKGLGNVAIKLNNHPGPAGRQAERAAVALRCTSPPFRFLDLPTEIRQEILSYCLLPPGDDTNILISPDRPKLRRVCCRHCLPTMALKAGYCACQDHVGGYSSTCICRKHTFATFRCSKLMYEDSTAVCFAQNRFVVHGHPETLDFLRSLPDQALYALRKLDILIKLREFHMYDERVPFLFEEIVDILATRCNVMALHLSLDSGPEESGDHFTYKSRTWYCYEFQGAWLITGIKTVVEALQRLGPLKRFEIFLPNCSDIENELEKMIMGARYDAYKFGKLQYSDRDPFDPHGFVGNGTERSIVSTSPSSRSANS